MNWQDLLKRPTPRSGEATPGKKTKLKVSPVDPPGFGPGGRLAPAGERPAPQPTEVNLKDQVMGGGDPPRRP